MNKAELIAKISEESKLTKKAAETALDAFVTSVEEALKNGEKVQLVGFGTFEVRERAARKGRNPQTKAEIKIPASKAPVFKAGKALKEITTKTCPYCLSTIPLKATRCAHCTSILEDENSSKNENNEND